MPKTKNIHRQMVVDIIHTANLLDYSVSSLLKVFDITHVQFNILRILNGAHPDPLTVGQVKERILFSNSDITRLIDRLILKSLVIRTTQKENRRKMDVSITKNGIALLDKIEPQLVELMKDFYVKEINKKDVETVSKVLKIIRG